MLETLYFTEDIKSRYRLKTDDTARRYMRQMGAKGSPLFVTERMISQWEATKRTVPAVGNLIPAVMKIPRRK